MPRPLPFGLTDPQRDCLIEAVQGGLLVPGEDGRYRRCLAYPYARSFQARVVASLIRRGLIARIAPSARALHPTATGYALGDRIART